MARLVIETGAQKGKEHAVRDRMKLGRLETCEVPLGTTDASREHAAIRLVKGRFYLIDLDSKNGTLVNGKRVKQAALAAGDEVEIGGVRLRYLGDEGDGAGPAGDAAAGEGEEEPIPPEVGAEARADATSPDPEAEDAPDAAATKSKRRHWSEALPPGQRAALEWGLFGVLALLAFLCTSTAAQIVLRLVATS